MENHQALYPCLAKIVPVIIIEFMYLIYLEILK